jgi:hypothetical protein
LELNKCDRIIHKQTKNTAKEVLLAFGDQKIDPKMGAKAAVKKLNSVQDAIHVLFSSSPVHPIEELNQKKRSHNPGFIRRRRRKVHKKVPDSKIGTHCLFFCPCCPQDDPTNFLVNISGIRENLPKFPTGTSWDEDSLAVPEKHLDYKCEWSSVRGRKGEEENGSTEAFVRGFKAHLSDHWDTHHSWGFYINAVMTRWDPPANPDGPVKAPNYVR